MDPLSFLTISIPGYFALGPLAIILIALVVFIGKKDKAQAPTPVTPSTMPPAPASTPSPSSTVTPAPMPQPSAPSVATASSQPVQTPATEPVATPAQHVESVPHPEPHPSTIEAAPSTPPAPPVTPPQAPEPAVVPPISSWRPLAPVTQTPEATGKSEAEMQAVAMAEERAPAPAVETTVVGEPVVTDVAQPVEPIPNPEIAVTDLASVPEPHNPEETPPQAPHA